MKSAIASIGDLADAYAERSVLMALTPEDRARRALGEDEPEVEVDPLMEWAESQDHLGGDAIHRIEWARGVLRGEEEGQRGRAAEILTQFLVPGSLWRS